MKKRSIAGICLLLGLGAFGHAQTQAPAPSKKEAVMARASGTFEVKMVPQDDKSEDANLGRMLLDKQFHGDLEATGKGQMLTAMTPVQGSAGYVAIEKVSGTLHGKTGTFVLQHTGTMTRGTPQLSITVVPDSGTGQLAGITGRMDIKVEGGKHSYELEYILAEAP